MTNNVELGEQAEKITALTEPPKTSTTPTPTEKIQEITKVDADAQIITQLSEKYGYPTETIEQMVSIHESLSLKDFFRNGHNMCVLEVVEDKGRQPIPVASSNFEINPADVVTIVEVVDGKNVEVEVIMKPVLNVRLLNTENKGKIYSRIPSNSEMIGLLKIEYQRLQQGMSMEGALIKIIEAKFVDKTGVERDGYAVEQVAREFVEKLLQPPKTSQ